MSKIFRETNGWILRYSGWRYAVPALILSFIGWIVAGIIFWLDQWKEKKLCKDYLKKQKVTHV